MAYEKQTDVPCEVGETVVRLTDTGDLVAVRCATSRDPGSNMNLFVPSARWIDAAGAPQLDDAGRAVVAIKTLSVAPPDVARLGAAAITRECLLLVLGEPLTPDPGTEGLTLIRWSAEVVAQCSIRHAIAAARVNAPAASDVL